MKRLLHAAVFATAIAAAGLLATAAAPTAARAETNVSVSFSYFHSNLSPHGRWFSHPRYGWTWRPHGVAPGWRPYTYGRWVWTADYGWMWASYYDWGWATFHYGRWVYEPAYGWYWVPGYTWGPAWVAWRYGDGFIGWYPLPPEAAWDPAIGIVYSGAGIYGAYYTPYWVFVPERYFLSTTIYNVVVRPHDNHRFIRNTRRSIHYRHVNNRVFNRGLDARYIRRVTGRPVVAVRPRVVTGRGDWRKAGPAARSVRILRPPVVERRGARTPKPGTGARRITTEPRRAAPQPRVEPRVQPRVQPRAQPKVQPQPERRAQPRVAPRAQPRFQPRVEPRVQPRAQPRVEPRYQPRAQPKVEPRYQPRAQPRVDPRYQPRVRPQPRVVPGAGGGQPQQRGGQPPQHRRQPAPDVRRDGGGGATVPQGGPGGQGGDGRGGRRWR